MKHKLIKIPSLIACILLISLYSCKRGSDRVEVGSNIFSKLPENTVGFVHWAPESTAYKSYSKTAWANLSKDSDDLLTMVKDHEGSKDLVEGIYPIINALQKTKLLEPSSDYKLSEGLGFISADSKTGNFSFGAVLNSGSNNSESKVTALKAELVAENLPVKDESAEGALTGFSLSISNGQTTQVSTDVYVFGAKGSIVLSSDTETAKSLLSDKPLSGFEKIKELNSYKSVSSKASDVSGRFVFGFLDVPKFLNAVAVIDKTAPSPKDFPVEAIGLARGWDGGSLTDKFFGIISAKTAEQKEAFAAFSSVQKTGLTETLPADLMIAIAVTQPALSFIRTMAASYAQDVTGPEIEPIITSLQEFAIGVGPSSSMPMFPDLFITLKTSDSAKTGEYLEKELSSLTGLIGVPMPQFMEKEINGDKVKYALTPLGVGVYMATLKDSVIVASGEEPLKKVMDSLNGKATLYSSLGSSGKTAVKDSSVGISYLDFSKMAGFMDTLGGSLAMFTGGSATGSLNSQIDRIKGLGTVLVGVKLKDGVLEVTSLSTPPPVGSQ